MRAPSNLYLAVARAVGVLRLDVLCGKLLVIRGEQSK